jgi:hypothetical protein
MLLQWSESSTRGRTVTFLVSEEQEMHPFRDFTIRSGKRAGQRFMAVLVQIGEDEAPVKKPKTLSQQAFLICRNPNFYAWVNSRGLESVVDETSARDYIYSRVGIHSRSQLDFELEAASRFQRLILKPFESYCQSTVALQ